MRAVRPRLRSRLAAACVLVAVIPILFVGVTTYQHERDVLIENALHDLNRVADLQEARLDAALGRRDDLLESWTGQAAPALLDLGFVGSSDGNGTVVDDILRSQTSQADDVLALSIVSSDGVVVNSSDPTHLGDVPASQTASLLAVGDPLGMLLEDGEGRLVHRCVGAIVVDDEIVGGIVMDGTLDAVATIATDFDLLGETGETTIAQVDESDGTARVVAAPRFGTEQAGMFVPRSGSPLAAAVAGERQHLTDVRDYRDEAVFAVTRPLGGSSWAMVVKIDRSEALGDIADLRGLLLAAGAVAIAVAMIVAWFIADRMTRPLASLTRTAQRIARGERSERAAVSGSPEIIELADAFNRMAESLEDHAVTDSLTRLPNRAMLTNRLDRALVRARRHGGIVAVLFCDLDGFKTINDAMGHGAGDQLLKQVADRLAAACRAGELACRFGGDEFVVVLESIDAVGEAADAAQRLLDHLNGPVELGGRWQHITVSIGVATSDGVSTNGEELLSDADSAMYRAKERGKARVELFDTGLRNSVETRLAVDRSLRAGIAAREIEVHYQPIVDFRTGQVVRAEALMRWRRDGVLVAPPEFLGVAAESTLIVDLGDVVLERVARDLAKLPESMIVTVNLSARELLDPTLVDRVRTYVGRHGLAARRLCVEVTEDAVFTDLDRTIGVLHELRELGVAAAIDDFGTGYSSLSHVRQIPASVLKIDQSFVSGLAEDADDAQIAQLVV
ncbi:MAG: diguanylate cyclase, partial [Acidimicrobiales bacterium]|nr:diguanylate cyclase [Acidimicrobiales bacterium]